MYRQERAITIQGATNSRVSIWESRKRQELQNWLSCDIIAQVGDTKKSKI